jgi:hypothetical protein
MGVFKQREIRAFHGFQFENHINSVTIPLTPAKTRPSGIFGRFDWFSPQLRTLNPGNRGGR